MQPSSATTPDPSPPSFAGMLADLAAPEKKFPPARDLIALSPNELDLDGLEDDVATISYEQALRTHARFRPQAVPHIERSEAAPEQMPLRRNLFASAPSTAEEESSRRKSASVTVRMSAAECDQLRKRAAEAGFTVSAYLRSCAFEVETLRAQVKDALAKLRVNAEPERPRRVWPWSKRA